MTIDEIYQEYKLWAKTHTPTWETDNLMGDIIGWKNMEALSDGTSGFDSDVWTDEWTPDSDELQERLLHVLAWLYTQDGNYDDKNEWRENLVGHLFWMIGLEDNHAKEK